MVNAGEVVETLQLGDAGKLEQVLIAGLVLCQQQQVGGFLVFLWVVFFDRAGCHVGFKPDDRLDPRLLGGVVELDHTKHGAVIGDGNGRHTHRVARSTSLGMLLKPSSSEYSV